VGTGGGRSGTSSANTVIPGITTTAANQDVIFVATERTTATGTTVTGVTGVSPTPSQDYYFENTASTATSLLVDHFTQATPGATGNATVTYSGGSGNGWGMMFGVATASAPVTTPTVQGTATTSDGDDSSSFGSAECPIRCGNWRNPASDGDHGSLGCRNYSTGRLDNDKTGTDSAYNVWWTGYRVVDGTESASYTWSWTSTTYHLATMVRVAGVNTASPIRASAVTSNASSATSGTGPTLSVLSTDREFYFFAISDFNGTALTAAPTISANYTIDYARTAGTKAQLLAHANAAGTVAAPTATSSSSASVYTGIGIALVATGGVSKTSVLADDFATKNTTKWTWGAAGAATGGRFVATATSTYTGSIQSVSAYDLSESAIYVQLLQAVVGTGTGSPETYFELFDSGTNNTQANSIQFSVIGTALTMFWRPSAGTYTQIASVTYSATTHAWLRIRHASGTLYWDTSPDGFNWTQQASVAASIPVNQMYVGLGGGYQGTFTPSTTAIFDNVNLPPAISTLTDDFSTKDTSKWFYGGTATATGGQLSIGVNTNYDGVISNYSYNATNSSATVQLVQAPNLGNGTTEFQFILRVDSSNGLWLSVNNGVIYCYYKTSGTSTQVASMPYNPKTHKYLRIMHDGTKFNWQYSYTGMPG
jgi:hypothetical protein